MEHEDTPAGREIARMAQAVMAGCSAMGQKTAQKSAAESDRHRQVIEQRARTQQAARAVQGDTVSR